MRRRTILGLSAATLVVSACEDFAVRPSPGPPRIEIFSGNLQSGQAGEWFPSSLSIRVTDGAGAPIHLAQIRWGVTSGSGYLEPLDFWFAPPFGSSAVTETGPDGLTDVVFQATALGSHSVSARARTVGGDSIGFVVFDLEANSMLVRIEPCGASPVCFLDPRGGQNPAVPVGTGVEWVNRSTGVVTLTSTSVPDGAFAFSSGPIDPGASFALTPEVAGIWSYLDEESGASGMLIVE